MEILAGSRSFTLKMMYLGTCLGISVTNRKEKKTEGMLLSEEEAVEIRNFLDTWIEKKKEEKKEQTI